MNTPLYYNNHSVYTYLVIKSIKPVLLYSMTLTLKANHERCKLCGSYNGAIIISHH